MAFYLGENGEGSADIWNGLWTKDATISPHIEVSGPVTVCQEEQLYTLSDNSIQLKFNVRCSSCR